MVSLGAFVISGTVSAGAGMVVNYDDVTKTWTCEADISTYTWTNTTGNNLWNDPENWMAGSAAATVAPSADTTVVFPSAANAWTVELTEKGYAKQIQANGDVVFSGALVALNDATENGVVGLGKITLGNNSGFEVTTGTLTILNSVEITAAASSQAQIAMNDYENLYLKGNLTGSGSIRLGADRSRIYLSGNNTGFNGSFITVTSPNDRSHVVFANAQATSSSASWTINSGIEKTGTSWNIVESYGQTYTFGELKGKFHNDTAAGRSTSKFEVGALNTDFAFTYYGVNNSSNDRYDSFRKVGSGKMEITGTYVRHYELADGTVKLMTDASLPVRDTADAGIRFEGGALQLAEAFTVDPSPKFVFIAGKTAVFDDEGIPRTFDAAIGNSVAANFIKKGAGALTLAAPPTYTGTTKVEDGVLYVINGDYTLTLDSSTAEVTTDKDGYRKFVPASVAISAPTVVWGDDFAKVTVSSEVTSNYGEGSLTYNLKIGGNVVDGAVGTVNNGVVTFSDVDVSELSISPYGNVSVEVTASAGGSQAATSGVTTAMLADAEEGWIDEKKSTTGTTGSWKTADGAAATVTYGDDDRVQLSDNKFSATNCSTGDVVTVTIKDVKYTALSDLALPEGDAQGSIALGGTDESPKFVVLTKNADAVQWSEAEGVAPALNTAYDIVFTFVYTNNTYSITVGGTPLTVGGSKTYDIVKTTNKYVKDIDFLGAGSIKAIEGIQYDAMMAVDQNGVRYATVDAALDANKNVKGAVIKLLHGTANTSIAGWRFDEATMSFIKKAMGMVFLAF